jgi:hypothetical protein
MAMDRTILCHDQKDAKACRKLTLSHNCFWTEASSGKPAQCRSSDWVDVSGRRQGGQEPRKHVSIAIGLLGCEPKSPSHA